MKLKPLIVDAVQITEVQGLDPILVYWEDFGDGKGNVTITCYGEAWTGYWNAMGNRTIKEFFADCDDSYLVNRLHGSQFQKHTTGHMTYLKRIVNAVRDSIKESQ